MKEMKEMKEIILNECRENLKRFSGMSDLEIYEWMCWNFATKDYPMVRDCSFIIYEESRKTR